MGAARADSTHHAGLRVTAPNGATNIILGVMHQGDARVPMPTLDILDHARRVVLESAADVPQPPAPQDAPSPDPSPPILMEDVLSPEQVQALKPRLACRLGERPWPEVLDMVTNSVLGLRVRDGADGAIVCPTPGRPSIEDVLKRAAAGRRMPVEVLEPVGFSLGQRKALPDRIFVSGLRRVLSPGFEELFDRLTDALRHGDYEAVCRLDRSGFATAEDADLHDRRMLAERNMAWMPRLERFLQDGGAIVAVGAAHLCGPTGLPDLLKVQGYRIERVAIPAKL